MSWLGIIQLVLSIVQSFVKKAEQKQLLDAGQALAINGHLAKSLEITDAAINARRAVKHTPDSVHNDPFNTDKK